MSKPTALEQLYDRWSDRLFGYLARTADPATAEELFQRLGMRLHAARGATARVVRWHPGSSPSPRTCAARSGGAAAGGGSRSGQVARLVAPAIFLQCRCLAVVGITEDSSSAEEVRAFARERGRSSSTRRAARVAGPLLAAVAGDG
jgi:hypothetical protein